jgi:hypothetical protein
MSIEMLPTVGCTRQRGLQNTNMKSGAPELCIEVLLISVESHHGITHPS